MHLQMLPELKQIAFFELVELGVISFAGEADREAASVLRVNFPLAIHKPKTAHCEVAALTTRTQQAELFVLHL